MRAGDGGGDGGGRQVHSNRQRPQGSAGGGGGGWGVALRLAASALINLRFFLAPKPPLSLLPLFLHSVCFVLSLNSIKPFRLWSSLVPSDCALAGSIVSVSAVSQYPQY